MVEASAPVRICDLGGWTDTWFGGPGRVLNMAVEPGVAVTIRPGEGPDPVVLDVPSFGCRYPMAPGQNRTGRHKLLEAAVDAVPPPAHSPVVITVRSAVPPGAGTGTSAAVAVAMVGALAALRDGQCRPGPAAALAHRLEVEVLGGESGVQDQTSVAWGGINYLEIDAYPEVRISPLPAWPDLDHVLSVVYLGQGHDSSAVHRQVIDKIRSARTAAMSELRRAAQDGRDAVLARDLEGLGRAMIANHRGQMALHPALVGPDARRVIEAAAGQEALGWKVNGAGGDGGTVTVLSATPAAKTGLDGAIGDLDPRYRVLTTRLSRSGLSVRGRLQDVPGWPRRSRRR